jgi:hypothetical protein
LFKYPEVLFLNIFLLGKGWQNSKAKGIGISNGCDEKSETISPHSPHRTHPKFQFLLLLNFANLFPEENVQE